MAILAFQKPDKVLMLEADNFFGKFEFRPLEPGYGIRSLFSSAGTYPRPLFIVNSIWKPAFGSKRQITKSGFNTSNPVSCLPISPALNTSEPETVILTFSFSMSSTICLKIENFRVEQKTDYEKLVLEIATDGSIHPKEALKEAAKILIHHFMLFSDEKIAIETVDTDGNEEFDEEVLHMRQLLKSKLADMDLSVRALNCLKAADVETLGELVKFNKNDLLKFRNFGKKSLTELDELLESLNLSFGMDITKYKLDKE